MNLVISFQAGAESTKIPERGVTMRRDYDVFEKFPDGSTLWRVCVSGRYEALRKVQELRERSENEFFTLDIQSHEFMPASRPTHSRLAAKAAAGG